MHCPSVELACVVGQLFIQHGHCLLVKVLGPTLALVVPLEEHEQIREALVASLVEEVVLASDTDLEVFAEDEELVLVAEAEHLLVFSLFVRVVALKFDEFLGVLAELEQVEVDARSFLH